jgi:hypothetical protein
MEANRQALSPAGAGPDTEAATANYKGPQMAQASCGGLFGLFSAKSLTSVETFGILPLDDGGRLPPARREGLEK